MKLKPRGEDEMRPLPGVGATADSGKVGRVSGERKSRMSADPEKRARQLANLAKGKALGGRKKGGKNKATIAVEQLKAAIALVPQAPSAATPLGVLTYHMLRAQAEFERLAGLPLPESAEEAESRVQAARAALRLAIECATLAAPYMHAKLASVEQNVKAGLRVTVRDFGAGKPA